MKDFIPYKEALALKELGFDEPCFGRFWGEEFKLINMDKQFEKPDYACVAPLYQQAFRWFREKYNLASHIATYWQHDWNNYSYQYHFVENKVQWNSIEHYKTYKEAELACLKKLIEIVKQKQL